MNADRLARLALVFIIEIGLACIVGGLVAAVLLPIVYHWRGYYDVGSEWWLIILAAYGAFTYINKQIFGERRK